ncbi:MAG: hypothetical protein M3016_04795 [Actinomycetota bacterium]|nr:hypothetical protein [Actinomycetota bacterium]
MADRTASRPGSPSSDGPTRFVFRFSRAYRRAGRIFGVTPAKAWLEVGGGALSARLGPWRLHTTLDNISAVEITGPYAFLKTAGPAHLGITDRGLTFATNGDRGVLITFREPVPGIEPTGWLRHPELTVTVADVEGLAALLREQTG